MRAPGLGVLLACVLATASCATDRARPHVRESLGAAPGRVAEVPTRSLRSTPNPGPRATRTSPTLPAPPIGTSISASRESVFYANCDDARAAGAAPIPFGSPGYRRRLDHDGDGVACDEPTPKPSRATLSPSPTPARPGVPPTVTAPTSPPGDPVPIP